MRKRIALKWYGGKSNHLKFILEYFPRKGIRHFVDVFGGAGHIVFNVYPYPVMTYNDINEDLVNFFRVLREQPDELLRRLALTPYSRSELRDAYAKSPYDDVERARFFFIRSRQTIHAMTHDNLGERQWSRTNKHGKQLNISAWLNSIPNLWDVVSCLQSVQIDSDPALRVIDAYDGEDVFFYLDPPYLPEVRVQDVVYQHDMTTDDHRELCLRLNGIRGKAAVSGYRHDLYDEWLDGWRRVDDNPKYCHSSGNDRQECLWLNY